MNPAQYVVRRANLDDLGGMKQLWERESLPVVELEKRLTEFQLISSLEGDLVGAVGLHIEGKHALLHSEAFTRPEEEDAFRPMVWERLKVLARNHGVIRLWTREQAPFWHQQAGFNDADAEILKKLPARFGDPHHSWRTIALREETADAVSLEKELELFQQTTRASTEQALAQARRMRTVALTVGMAVFLASMGAGFYLLVRWMRQSSGGRSR